MLTNLTNKAFHRLGERNIRNKFLKIIEREGQVLYLVLTQKQKSRASYMAKISEKR